MSFNLQETVLYNRELGGDTYAAFLDTSKAFDTVWHSGLFLKLLEFGLPGKFLRLLINSYTAISSCVVVNGVRSSVFPLMQGARQGGIMSTWLYLLYIDELLNLLETSNLGSQVGVLK